MKINANPIIFIVKILVFLLACIKELDEIRYVRFEVSTAVAMKNGVFWYVTPCGSCKNRRFGGTWRLLHKGNKNR
jgi:hypothetical protein